MSSSQLVALSSQLIVLILLVSVTNGALPENRTDLTSESETLSSNIDDVIISDVNLHASPVPGQFIGKSVRQAVERLKPLLMAASDRNEEHHDYDHDNDEDELGDPEPPKYTGSTKNINETVAILKMWSRLTHDGIEAVIKEATPLILQLSYDSEMSSECSASFLKIFNGLRKQELWAFRIVDSYGRLAPGFLDGTVSQFGEFDECLGVTFADEFRGFDDHHYHKDMVVGKYCMMKLNVPLPPRPRKVMVNQPIISFKGTELEGTILDSMAARLNQLYTLEGFRFGICIPSTCTAMEIEHVVNKVIGPLLHTNVQVGPDEVCTTRLDKYTFNTTQLVALYILTGAISITGFATIFHLTYKLAHRTETSKIMPSKATEFVLAFSVIQNTSKLFHIRDNQEGTLSAVHGMRVLSMVWIIVGHTYCFGGFYKVLYTFKRLAVDSISKPSQWTYQPLINAFLLVETFFFLGGVVLVYVALPMLEKHRGKFNYVTYVVHRWQRLTPALLGVICFIIITPSLGSGPIWKKEMNWQSEGCQKNWWLSLLYLNNWIEPVDEMCGGQTWFIAADFQIYLFAPIIFLAYYRSAKLGLAVNLVLLFGGMASSGISAYFYSAEPTFILDHVIDLEMLHEYSRIGYFPTYHHIAPYCLGTLVGYFILKYRENGPKMPRMVQIVGWIVFPLMSTFVMLCTKGWNNAHDKVDPSQEVSIVYAIFQRVTWCMGVAWVTFACATGYGGIVNTILSWKGFIPLSRLSYSIYMVHLIPIFLRVNSLRYTRPWDDFAFMSWAVFNIILGIVGAYLLYILFESPINSLERILLRPTNGRQKSNGSVDANGNVQESADRHTSAESPKELSNDDISSHSGSSSSREDNYYSPDTKVDISLDSSSDSGRSSRKSTSTGDCSVSKF
ncbi:Nose resistant to fluoxetine protein 6 [Halotydeus destructor]|nr:Nose resistant to fluoxetine protein 6 [Halotydeus destructor]